MNELNQIMRLMSDYTFDSSENGELGEQGEAGGGGASAPYPTVTKWETGLARSVANQIDSKSKWKDLYKITRGKANTLL